MSILTEKIEIRIDGKKYDEDYTFSDIRLVQEVQKPNELRFLMHKRNLSEDENYIRFSLSEKLVGKEVEFSLVASTNNEEGKKTENHLDFLGIIFNVNIVRKNLKAGAVIEVIAYSPDYLLFDNPHCCSYENETLKDIVAKTVEPYSDSFSIINDPQHVFAPILYTVQYNETNYAFLSRLASRYGAWLYYNGEKLVFGKLEKLDTQTLLLGCEVLNYEYSLDMEHLNFTHAYHNYLEYSNVKEEGLSSINGEMHNLTDVVFNTSKSLYKKTTFEHLKSAAAEENFDEAILSTSFQGMGKKAQMMTCKGSSIRADLQIGSVIKIKEYYEKANGDSAACFHDELLIYKITHIADEKGNYKNLFTAMPATGEQPYPPYYHRNPYPQAETQRAVVMDNKDEKYLGRVRVQFLWQKEQDENMMTPWIRIAQPHGGENKGFYFIPEIDEEVMVGFENGNAEKPYVIGTLWHGEQRHLAQASDENYVKAIATRNHTIEFRDDNEFSYVDIYDKDDNYLVHLSADKQLIRLYAKGNIILNAESDIILEAQNNIKISAGGDVSISAGGNIDETAGNNMTLGASENISMNAGNDMDRSVGNNETLFVSSNQTVEIGANKEESIAEKYQLTAETIREEATNMLQLYGKKIEERSDSTIRLDGGSTLDLYAGNIRIN